MRELFQRRFGDWIEEGAKREQIDGDAKEAAKGEYWNEVIVCLFYQEVIVFIHDFLALLDLKSFYVTSTYTIVAYYLFKGFLTEFFE